MQFSSKSSTYTKHCGIISLNNRYIITPIDTGIDGRFILAHVHYATEEEPNSSNSIATILNIYGKAASRKDNVEFYTELMQHRFLIHKITTIQNNMIILGDFNYKYESRRSNGTVEATTVEWTALLEEYFIDCFWENKSATFHGSNNLHYILDYIFCNNTSYGTVTECTQEFMNPTWTDHEMLVITLQLQKDATQGPGAYKCNPFLANNHKFRRELVIFLQGLQPQVELKTATQSPQEIWDWIKDEFKEHVRQFQLEEVNWRRKALKTLQAKRNRCMRAKKNRGLIFQGLDTINQQIGALQDSIAEIEVLKLGKYWRENGEKNAGFLKKLTVSRQNQRQLKQLRHPVTQELHSDQGTMSEIAGSFYTNLYTPTPPDARSMRLLLDQITPDMQLDGEQQSLLELPVELDDLLFECKRSPKFASPGSDGIPYQLLRLILKFPPLHSLITTVYNDALTKGIFPASWNVSLMTILYKKNDPNDMANYRPISLCNTDYKLLTRLLNHRMMEVAKQLINENQAGFVPGRFIAQNALRCQVIMEDAERTMNLAKKNNVIHQMPKAIGLSLDQEKAYDRVNLSYLQTALITYGFPANLVRCIINMMGQNLLRINVNGYFTDDIPKLRGLKQGDPISSILYNLAIEPFLRSILNDPLYHGYQMQYATDHPNYNANDPLVHVSKILCYADDAFVFVQDLPDLARLEYHLDVYCNATNAKINYNKVEAISLSGQNTWSYWQARLSEMNITKFTSNKDSNPVIYLGFPLLQSVQQREVFIGGLVDNLRTATKIHSVRSLSVVGKATVLNSLILSKCWYVLRVTPFAQSNVQAIQSICTKFLRKGIFPVIPWATWTKPKPLGGLGVLDVALQQSALYFRWVQPLLHPSDSPHILDLMLVMLVNKQNQSAHVQVPLLFPLTRTTGLTKQRTNTVTMIYKSVDRLKRINEPVHLNIATASILPVKAILQPSATVSKMPIRATQLQVKDLYQPNPDQPLQLEARKAPTIPADIRRACKKILKQINENKVHIQPYFSLMLQPPQGGTNRTTDISFKPFIDSYDFNSQQGLTRQISTRTFRTACIEAHTSSIARSNWNFFWSLSLNLVHRNVIYRFLTHTIPTKRLLHYFEIAESPLCPICGNEENAVHLLFLCSSKASIWKAIIFEFLWPTVSIGDIIQACSSLDFENIKYVSKSYTTAHMVVLVTLGNIWRAQVRMIFHSTPFIWIDVVQQIKNELLQLHAQTEIHKQL
ncbi:uncharacterized protein ATC70_009140 [Mucor velutinosus]|uniref:Reverse transcriptase domain-containing protein n=2 Tax=Mucor velutinosus TaxID=708070 RepID=A0AAN7HPB4_9FUNG|nr:hypothetical protein ATC70_009140 [Mucor velutinosus]